MLNSDFWVSVINASEYWSLVYNTMYTIHAGVLETITIDGYGGSFTTNADGTASHALPLGEITLTGSVSEQSFTRTVTSDTTEVYVMPEGALYWYGNECTDVTGGWYGCGGWNYGGANYKQEKYTNYLYTESSSDLTHDQFVTNNKIDFSKYSHFNLIHSCNIGYSAWAWALNAYNKSDGIVLWISTRTMSKSTDKIDLSSINDASKLQSSPQKIVSVGCHAYSSSHTIYAVWLE